MTEHRWTQVDRPMVVYRDVRPGSERPARTGDTIDAPCPGDGEPHWHPDGNKHPCDGNGTIPIRLTADPIHHDDECPLGPECDDTMHSVGWVCVGEDTDR